MHVKNLQWVEWCSQEPPRKDKNWGKCLQPYSNPNLKYYFSLPSSLVFSGLSSRSGSVFLEAVPLCRLWAEGCEGSLAHVFHFPWVNLGVSVLLVLPLLEVFLPSSLASVGGDRHDWQLHLQPPKKLMVEGYLRWVNWGGRWNLNTCHWSKRGWVAAGFNQCVLAAC